MIQPTEDVGPVSPLTLMEGPKMSILLIILLVVVLFGGGGWGYSRWRGRD